MTVLFGDFLNRFTGGKYDRDTGNPLYYRTVSFPIPKRILSFNASVGADTLKALRTTDNRPLYWDASMLNRFEVLSVSRYGGFLGKGTLISLEAT